MAKVQKGTPRFHSAIIREGEWWTQWEKNNIHTQIYRGKRQSVGEIFYSLFRTNKLWCMCFRMWFEKQRRTKLNFRSMR